MNCDDFVGKDRRRQTSTHWFRLLFIFKKTLIPFHFARNDYYYCFQSEISECCLRTVKCLVWFEESMCHCEKSSNKMLMNSDCPRSRLNGSLGILMKMITVNIVCGDINSFSILSLCEVWPKSKSKSKNQCKWKKKHFSLFIFVNWYRSHNRI